MARPRLGKRRIFEGVAFTPDKEAHPLGSNHLKVRRRQLRVAAPIVGKAAGYIRECERDPAALVRSVDAVDSPHYLEALAHYHRVVRVVPFEAERGRGLRHGGARFGHNAVAARPKRAGDERYRQRQRR